MVQRSVRQTNYSSYYSLVRDGIKRGWLPSFAYKYIVVKKCLRKNYGGIKMKDYFGYKDRTCVVTGAASGMGRACTEELVDLGAKVFALDVVDVQVPGIYTYIKCNMGDKKSIDDAFMVLPNKIDKFFGFAGISGVHHDPKTTITVNFVGNQYTMREYLSKRVPEDGGAILICTSIGANRWYAPINKEELIPLVEATSWEESMKILDVITIDLAGALAYTYSKRAIGYYTTKFATEMAPKHVRVNAIKPAPTMTGLTNDFCSRERLCLDDWVKKYCGDAGRVGLSREMAEPAIFLNSDMASYISGVELIIDYGGDAKTYLGGDDIWLVPKLTHRYVK